MGEAFPTDGGVGAPTFEEKGRNIAAAMAPGQWAKLAQGLTSVRVPIVEMIGPAICEPLRE